MDDEDYDSPKSRDETLDFTKKRKAKKKKKRGQRKKNRKKERPKKAQKKKIKRGRMLLSFSTLVL